MKRIFLIGLTSSRLGGMEYHNLGNYAIMEPLIIYLKKTFPDAKIVTSIQMSDAFCEKFGIECKRQQRFWTYGKKTGITTLKDICCTLIWAMFHYLLRMDVKFLLKSSSLLNEIYEADLVVDFSGDIFGDNANYRRFLEASAELVLAKIIGKPVAMLIGSPGPFKKKWRQWLGRFVMNRVDLITNREPLSTEILKSMGVRNNRMFTTACPAFLFKPRPGNEVEQVLKDEGIISNGKKPLVGMILCGWNMPKAPNNKIPRQESELSPFVTVIRHLIEKMNVRVLLMSHQNATDENGQMIRGNDHAIVEQVMNLLKNAGYDNNLFTLKGCYDAATSKAIISCFDMLISGRIHGSVGGLSQDIPTVIIDYGHEPKAHKLRGFARVADVEEFICDPRNAEDMIRRIALCWERREEIREKLKTRIEEVKRLAKSNFEMLQNLI
jgi:colanic acid/amylovoran biosynthesis protein